MIPLIDVSINDPSLKKRISDKIASLMDRSEFIGGNEVDSFAKEFAAYCGGGYCAPVGNGTDALALALRALGVGPGDEVITVPFTFIATAEAISHVGADIRFVDIDPKTYTLDPKLFEKAVSSKTKAVIPVHLFGHPCDMDPIMEIARKKGIYVIEDAAQAHGAEYKGRRAGTIGDAGCFSFYPTKNLGGFGDGGAVVSKSPDLIDRINQLANHGRSEHYHHDHVGGNSRLDAIQAAILRLKLTALDAWNENRRRLAKIYNHQLAVVDGIGIPVEASGARHVYHLYCIKSDRRDEIQRLLKSENIGTGVYYPVSLHLQPAYAFLGLRKGAYPRSEETAQKLLALPMFPHLKESAIDEIVRHLKRAVLAPN